MDKKSLKVCFYEKQQIKKNQYENSANNIDIPKALKHYLF